MRKQNIYINAAITVIHLNYRTAPPRLVSMMDLEESLVLPFTTPTTCFSSSPCSAVLAQKTTKNRSFRFATENHILGVSSSHYQPVVHGSIVSRDRHPSTVICVGYAQYPVTSNNNSNDELEDCRIEALALVDPLLLESNRPEDDVGPLMSLRQAISGDGNHHNHHHHLRDDMSVASTHFSTVQQGSKASSRGPSLNSSTSGALATATATSFETSMRSMSLVEQHDDPTFHIPMVATPQTQATDPPKARLILQLPPTASPIREPHDSPSIGKSIVREYVALVDFRPLSPCVAKWGDDTVGMFVGSADDSKLRWYVPSSNGRLVARSDDDYLPKEHFHFESPIMGIDFYSSDSDSHCTLAVVGQDGTIQLISWYSAGNGNNPFDNLSSHRVIVDGPLVSVHIQPQRQPQGQATADGDKDVQVLRVVIGSLCGYVCTLTKIRRGTTNNEEWIGPEMVVQGLWNSRIGDEDSVLAVCALGDCIALGTFCGRCMIYQKASHYNSPHYRLLWDCTLPYSIHGLELRHTENGSFDFVVLTRRSLHIFQPTSSSTHSLHLPPAAYCIKTATERLKRMLERPPPPTPLPVEPLTDAIATTSGEDAVVVDLDTNSRDMEEASTTTTTTATSVLGDTLLAVELMDEWDAMPTAEAMHVVGVSGTTEPSDTVWNEDSSSIPEQTEPIHVDNHIPADERPNEANESSDDGNWVLVDDTPEETTDTNPETDEQTIPLS